MHVNIVDLIGTSADRYKREKKCVVFLILIIIIIIIIIGVVSIPPHPLIGS